MDDDMVAVTVKQECLGACDIEELQGSSVNGSNADISMLLEHDTLGGIDEISHSSYSAAINLAHKTRRRIKQERDTGLSVAAYSDLDARQPLNYNHVPEFGTQQCSRKPPSKRDCIAQNIKQELPEDIPEETDELCLPEQQTGPDCLSVATWHGDGFRSELNGCNRTMARRVGGEMETTECSLADNSNSDRMSGADQYKCGACSKLLHSPHSLDGQMIKQDHVCVNRAVPKNSSLKGNGKVNDKRFSCDTCSLTFRRMYNLTIHTRTHTGIRPFACGECDATFTQHSHLASHKRTHSGERPYGCNTCGARFKQHSHLNKHKRSHLEDKPFVCDTCNARFREPSYLAAHKRSHSQERIYACDWCDARFSRSSYLTTHRRLHTGERPYVCEFCDSKFTQRSNYTRHRWSHLGHKPHACDVCDARFAYSSSLTSHKRLHTGEKPYACDICDVRFASCSNRNSHRKTHLGKSLRACSKFKKKSRLVKSKG